jgi:hypothetical protein
MPWKKRKERWSVNTVAKNKGATISDITKYDSEEILIGLPTNISSLDRG